MLTAHLSAPSVHDAPGGLRFVQAPDDHLEPMLGRRDYVLLAPVDRWSGQGYYIVSLGADWKGAFVCDVVGPPSAPMIRLHCTNKLYPDQKVTLQQFAEVVIGKVAMMCKLVAGELLPP